MTQSYIGDEYLSSELKLFGLQPYVNVGEAFANLPPAQFNS